MAGSGQYTVLVKGKLDDSKIRQQLESLGNKVNIGGKNGIGGISQSTNKTAAGVRKLNAALDSTNKKVKKVHTTASGLSRQKIKMPDQFKQMQKEVGKTNSKLTELGGTIKNRLAVSLLDRAIYGGVDAMGAMVNKVFDLDAALTEYRKVSSLSGKELEQYTADAYKMGRTVAKTGTEVIEASTSFKKMGYSDKESLQLAKVATTFQNIADTQITAGQSADFINSQMKAFNITANDAVSIIDSVNEVANNFSVGTGDLQGALTVAGSSLKSVGNDFNQTIGLVTAATELMPGKAQTVGNAFRTIGINISAMAQKNDEWVAANGKVNVALKDSQGELRSTFDIMKDLYTGVDGQSEAWSSLSEAEKSAIGVAAGGKTRYQQFVAAMDNFSAAIEANETAQKAQGSAARENAKYLDSLQGRLQNLRSAFEELAYKTLSSDTLGKGLEVLTKVVEFLSSDFGQLAIKATLAFTAINLLVKAGYALKGLSVVKFAKDLTSVVKGAESASSAVSGLGKVISNTSSGAKSIVSAFSGIGVGGVAGIAAAVAAIGGMVYATYKVVHAADEAKSKYNETASELQKNQAEIKSLKSKAGGLTNAEADRLALLQQQTAELQKQAGIDAQSYLDKTLKKAGGKTGSIGKATSSDLKKEGEADIKAIDEAKEKVSKAQQDYYDVLAGKDVRTESGGRMTEKQAKKNLQESSDFYDKWVSNAKKEYQAVEEAFQAKINAGGKLTEDEKKAREVNKSILKSLDEYKSIDPGEMDVFKNMFPNADKLAETESGLATMRDRVRQVEKAMNSSAKGKKAFKGLLDDIEGGYKNLGKYDKDTGKFEFDNKNIDDYAKALGLTKEKTEELLDAQTKAGNIEWKFSDKEIEDFSKSLKKADGTLTDTDGNIVTTNKNVKKLAQSLGIPESAISSLTGAIEDAGGTIVDFGSKDVSSTVSDLSKLGKTVGITTNELGKIKSVNVESLVTSMDKMGASKDQIVSIVSALKDMDGVEFEGDYDTLIKGAETAEREIDKILGQDGDVKKEVDIDANTSSLEEAQSEWNNMSFSEKVAVITGNNTDAQQKYKAVEGYPQLQKWLKIFGNNSDAYSKYNALKNLSPISVMFNVTGQFLSSGLPAKVKEWLGFKKGTRRAYASGTKNVIPAEVNEQGFEIIQDGKTGLMRIADGGKRTNTMLGVGDAVYTHGQSMRMLQKAGITEASVLQGKVGDIILNGIQKLPGFKSGKKRKKQIEKLRDKFDKQVDILEWKRDYYNWSDETFNKAYTKLYKKYRSKLKKLKSTLTGDQKRDYKMSLREASMERGKEETESFIEGMVGTEDDLTKAEAMVSKLRKDQKISAKEAAEYRKEAKQANLEYWEELYERGKKTYAELKTQLKTYYDQGVISAKEYYEKLANLAENEVDKKKEQFSTEYDFARAYVERQISLQEKENDLITAKSDLLTAQSQKVKVYKEGIGFVYQADEDAVREAEQNVKSYDNEWQKILDLMDEMEEVANLEELYEKGGKNVPLDVLGTDINAWQKWIEENQKNQLAYGSLSDMSGRDVRQFLDEKGNIKDSKLGEFAFNTKSFVAPNLVPSTYSVADINQMRMATDIGKTSSAGVTNNYNFGDLSLPNVTDADTFVKELNNLQNKAIQVSADRG